MFQTYFIKNAAQPQPIDWFKPMLYPNLYVRKHIYPFMIPNHSQQFLFNCKSQTYWHQIHIFILNLYLKLIQLICFRYTALRTHLTWNLHCFNTPHVHFVAKLERFWTSMGFPTMWLKSTLFWGSKWIGVNIRKFQFF